MDNHEKLILHTDHHLRLFLAKWVLLFDHVLSSSRTRERLDPLLHYNMIRLTSSYTSGRRGSLHVGW